MLPLMGILLVLAIASGSKVHWIPPGWQDTKPKPGIPPTRGQGLPKVPPKKAVRHVKAPRPAKTAVRH